LVASWQLRAIGLTRDDLKRLRRSDGWEVVSDRVLAVAGVPWTGRRRAMAGVLDCSPGATASHTTAAAVFGAPGGSFDHIHVSRHRGISTRNSGLAVVHEVIDLLPHHVLIVDGLPVTSPARTCFEMAALWHPKKVEYLVDWFWRERIMDGRTLDRTVRELARRGRTGSTLMRNLNDARGPDYVPPGSGLEGRFAEVLEWNGLPAMERQVDVGGDDGWTGRIDFRDKRLPHIVEVQSEKYHTSLVDRAADALRLKRLDADGFEVTQVWDTDIWQSPKVVADAVFEGRRRAAQRAAHR
jgi:very-short-patch-repair endonuclease